MDGWMAFIVQETRENEREKRKRDTQVSAPFKTRTRAFLSTLSQDAIIKIKCCEVAQIKRIQFHPILHHCIALWHKMIHSKAKIITAKTTSTIIQ